MLLISVAVWYGYKPTPPPPKPPWRGTEGYYLVQRSEWRREWGRESDGFLVEWVKFYQAMEYSDAAGACSRAALAATLNQQVEDMRLPELKMLRVTFYCIHQVEGAKMPPPETGWDPAWGDPNNPTPLPPTKYPRGPKGK